MAMVATYRDPHNHQDYVEVIVIRHGETACNAYGRYQGQMDVELNNVRRAQAAAVAERLSKNLKVSAVYSSDLQSAHETAEIIAAKCGGLEIVKDPDLKERHLGVLQGITRSEALQTNREACRAKDYGEEIPGGGESLDQVAKRCTSALKRIGKKHKGKRVAVVTHSGVLKSLYKKLNRDSPVKVIRNASVNILRMYKDEWLLNTWNDARIISTKHNFFNQVLGVT